MNSFSHSISVKTADFNGQLIRVISISIVLSSSRFPLRADPLTVAITDGVSTVKSWILGYSGNRKEVDSWFTTDAFQNMGNAVTVIMDFDFELFGEISNVDISNFINLPPNTDPDVIDANNAWLQSILNA